MSILIIVESPVKIKKLLQILGSKYKIEASNGSIRDLDKKTMSINFENHFEPIYVITKPDVVKKLKEAMKNVDTLYIGSDLDYEGSAIGQSYLDILKPKHHKRLIFNSITKEAVLNAVKNAGELNKDQVAAQKTRRVVDRLFGYLISPILQRQIGGKLSAGRVQSPTVRLVIEKENEINNFLEKNSESSFFKVHGCFSKLKSILHESSNKNPFDIKEPYKGKVAQIPLVDEDNPNIKVIALLKRCLKSEFRVHSIEDKISTRSPSPPFTTSTLLQEANRKFGMPLDSTMKTAQKLYEGGFITYMRTDSVEISPQGHEDIKKVIEEEYGKEFYQKNVYKNESESSQEAHEAIRPTHPDLLSLEKEVDDPYQIKLYKLIWQRSIASQMKPAKINVTVIQISISKFIEEQIEPFYYFQSQIEKIIFPGFMRVYVESVDDPIEDETISNFTGKVPMAGDKVIMEEIVAKQEFPKPPSRYTQGSLVEKIKKLGIGRPSTYVNTIKTIIDRDYIKIADVPGIKKESTTYTIKSENKKHIMSIFEDTGTVLVGKENKKFIPTNLGITVNDFLMEHFPEMMDYKFTAKIEEEMDIIANGNKVWYKVVEDFYDKLKPIVDELISKEKESRSEGRSLGVDEEGNEIYATKTKYGPAVKKKMGSKFVYAKIEKPLTLDNIQLNDAIKLFEYPKLLGKYQKKMFYCRRVNMDYISCMIKRNIQLVLI